MKASSKIEYGQKSAAYDKQRRREQKPKIKYANSIMYEKNTCNEKIDREIYTKSKEN